LGLPRAPEARCPAPITGGSSRLKSEVALADASHMPKFMTMKFPLESEQPGNAGDGESPEADPAAPGSGQEGLTPDRLTKVIRNMESGFYDTPEVREHIARRIREELDP
jgi:hypothetical protein